MPGTTDAITQTLSIRSPVGNAMKNDPADVAAVKAALQQTGDMDAEPHPHGYITRDMDRAVRTFQKRKGLKIDGYLLPGGETEQALATTQNTYDRKYLDKVETLYREYVKIGKKYGLDEASVYLDHYLDGTGTPVTIDSEIIRRKKFIMEGEGKNRSRFENITLNNPLVVKKLSRLKSGEGIEVEDYWDYGVGYNKLNPRRNHVLRGDIGEVFATGNSNIQSRGKFKITKSKDSFFVDGNVDHEWGDVYDFDVYGSGGAGAVALQKSGRAQPFNISSRWRQKVNGNFNIENNRLTVRRFQWVDDR